VAGPTQSLVIPDPTASRVRVAVVNDTHEHGPTIAALGARIEAVQPDVLVWNGDTCGSAFDAPADLPRVLLKPGCEPVLDVCAGQSRRARSLCARDFYVPSVSRKSASA